MMTYYRNKTYVAFDGDEDMNYYRLLQAWRDNEHIDFGFYDAHDLNIARDSSLSESIKAQLRERMHNSKVVLLLVGARTKYIRGYIPWEIGLARHLDLPIIVSNINGHREYDPDRCPSAIEDGKGAIHISFEARIIKHALGHWPDYCKSNTSKIMESRWYYNADQYRELGI